MQECKFDSMRDYRDKITCEDIFHHHCVRKKVNLILWETETERVIYDTEFAQADIWTSVSP